MAEKKEDLSEFRCKKCGGGNTYVKKMEGSEDYKVRVCRRCGFEEKLSIDKIQGKK